MSVTPDLLERLSREMMLTVQVDQAKYFKSFAFHSNRKGALTRLAVPVKSPENFLVKVTHHLYYQM